MDKILRDSNNFFIANFRWNTFIEIAIIIIKIYNVSCIVAIFPMTVENLMDLILKPFSDHSITDHLKERFIFVLSLGLPSIIFVVFRHHSNFEPIVFIILNISASNAITVAVYNIGISFNSIFLFCTIECLCTFSLSWIAEQIESSFACMLLHIHISIDM